VCVLGGGVFPLLCAPLPCNRLLLPQERFLLQELQEHAGFMSVPICRLGEGTSLNGLLTCRVLSGYWVWSTGWIWCLPSKHWLRSQTPNQRS
jgi:hypothetical protein